MLDTTIDLNHEKLTDNLVAVHRGVNMIRQHKEFKLVPVLVRLLAQGEPVSVERLASEGGWPEDEVRAGLGHFFSSRGAASAWLAKYPDGFLHSVAEDFEVHRQVLAELGWTE